MKNRATIKNIYAGEPEVFYPLLTVDIIGYDATGTYAIVRMSTQDINNGTIKRVPSYQLQEVKA